MSMWIELRIWLLDPPYWYITGVTIWWMLSWIVFQATLLTAVVMGLLRGIRPDARALRRSLVIPGGLLVFCLIPRLLAAPGVRPYPPVDRVLQNFMLFSACGLAAAIVAFGLGRGILWVSADRQKAPK